MLDRGGGNGGPPAHGPPFLAHKSGPRPEGPGLLTVGVLGYLNLKSTACSVPSLSVTTSCLQLFAQDLSVFQP
jgi:hypothetical protein